MEKEIKCKIYILSQIAGHILEDFSLCDQCGAWKEERNLYRSQWNEIMEEINNLLNGEENE